MKLLTGNNLRTGAVIWWLSTPKISATLAATMEGVISGSTMVRSTVNQPAPPERAASITSGCGWPWSEAMMICLTT